MAGPEKTADRDPRARLLEAARSIFAHKGYAGATVKELADAAGVNISMVSYYFGGKEGLYRACLEEAGQSRLGTVQRILTPPQSTEDLRARLRLYAEEHLLYFAEQKDICTILQRECASDMALTRDIFRDTFARAYETLLEFFQHARRRKLLRPGVDPELASLLFFGSIMSIGRFEPLSQLLHGKSLVSDRATREGLLNHATGPMIEGFLA